MRKKAGGPAAQLEKALRVASRGHYVLRLYVSGSTPRSRSAVETIRGICERYFAGRYELEVVDVYQRPGRASAAQVVVAPTLVKELPPPVRRLVGELDSPDRVLLALSIGAAGKAP